MTLQAMCLLFNQLTFICQFFVQYCLNKISQSKLTSYSLTAFYGPPTCIVLFPVVLSPQISLQCPVDIINPVDKTKLSCYTDAARQILQKLTPLFICENNILLSLQLVLSLQWKKNSKKVVKKLASGTKLHFLCKFDCPGTVNVVWKVKKLIFGKAV